jgi:rSAM/selenodomain-associated transferase 2
MYFSIIIPALNEAQTITTCLAAIQAYREIAEIIVVDGSSTDNTYKQAQLLCDRAIVSDRGRAIQMNAGANYAIGDVLIFLHADTFLPVDALNRIATNINHHHQWGRFDVELRGSHPMLKVVAKLMNWRSRLTGIATGDQAVFVTKQLFESVGRYPEIALMEDIALSKKLKVICPPICLKDKAISSGRRWEQFGVLKTILLMWSLRLRYFFGADPARLAQLYREGEFWKM